MQASASQRASTTPLGALWKALEGGTLARPPREPGVTPDGRFAYRWDDEGHFFACPVKTPVPGGR